MIHNETSDTLLAQAFALCSSTYNPPYLVRDVPSIPATIFMKYIVASPIYRKGKKELTIADLGAGNGIDALFLVNQLSQADVNVKAIAFEIDAIARKIICSLFQRSGRDHLIDVRTNFHDTGHLGEIDIAYMFDSGHYQSPEHLYQTLIEYTKFLNPDGIMALAMRTPNNSLLQEKREHADGLTTFDLNRIIFDSMEDLTVHGIEMAIGTNPAHSTIPKVNMWFYTQSQLEAIARHSGFKILDSGIVRCNSDDLARYEEFAFLSLRIQ